MRANRAQAAEPRPAPAAAALEGAQTELAELARLLPLVRRLMAPPRGQRGVLRPRPTPEQEERQAELIAEERIDALENLRDGIVAQGRSPAPASIPATDVAVLISTSLLAVERRMWARLAACPVPGPGTDAARLRRIGRHLSYLEHVPTIRAITRDLAAAVRAASNLVDGEPRRRLNSSCPYCHRDSLVIYQRDERAAGQQPTEHRDSPTEFIRCDKPPFEPCICPAEDCQCKSEHGENYRHLWTRDRGGWDTLAKLITEHDRTCVVCKTRHQGKELERTLAHGDRLGLTRAETREVIEAWPENHPANEIRLAMTRRARSGDWKPEESHG
ncbi:MAG: hypothetical protein JWM93_3982 [Frankiales bacterium]|nr:hypothetical protein [Frankiales bacterium]